MLTYVFSHFRKVAIEMGETELTVVLYNTLYILAVYAVHGGEWASSPENHGPVLNPGLHAQS